MAKMKTQLEFETLVKARFPLLKVVGKYVGANENILARDKYGFDYDVRAGSLLSSGHPNIQTAIDKTAVFKFRLFKKQPLLTVIGEYRNQLTEIEVVDENGFNYMSSPSNLLSGIKPSIRTAINKTHVFKSRVYKTMPEFKILSEYTNKRAKVLVEDGDGVQYVAPAGQLLAGSRPTVRVATDKNKYYKVRFSKVHGSEYDYSKINCIDSDTEVEIVCLKHGSFWQTVGNHIGGSGCPICSYNPGRWSHTEWVRAGLESSNLDSFKIYAIEGRDKITGEFFIKIGKTFTTISKRYGGYNNSLFPYDGILLASFVGGMTEIEGLKTSKLEVEIHRKFKDSKYSPKISFAGDGECFNMSIKDDLLALDFDEILSNL